MAPVGVGGKHLRLSVSQGGKSQKMIAFGMGAKAEWLFPGTEIDAVYTIGVNEWNGNREVQLKVIDLRANRG
jgi:single-stranded-DNA-specific exonuclease